LEAFGAPADPELDFTDPGDTVLTFPIFNPAGFSSSVGDAAKLPSAGSFSSSVGVATQRHEPPLSMLIRVPPALWFIAPAAALLAARRYCRGRDRANALQRAGHLKYER